MRADRTFALADVLALAGRRDEDTAEAEKALELYERKGHVPGAANAQRLLGELASTSSL